MSRSIRRGRKTRAVLLAPVRARHWRAILGAFRYCEQPLSLLAAHVFRRSASRRTFVMRTPCGPVELSIGHPHDATTIVEVFCREDYRLPPSASTVLDLGANIGISSAYFLSRHPEVRVIAYEPVARNRELAQVNLVPFGDRVQLRPEAVGPRTEIARFGLEETGRYGGIGVPSSDSIEVPCRAIAEVLEEAMDELGGVDLLKIDTEGLEVRTVAAIPAGLLDRVGAIVFEAPGPRPIHVDRFRHSADGGLNRLERIGPQRSPS